MVKVADDQWDWDAGVWWRAREHRISVHVCHMSSVGERATVRVTVTVTVTAAKVTVTVTGTGQAWVGELSGAVSSTFSLRWLVECWIMDTLCMDIPVFF